jgi:SPX domain protein involved in polyphosphate accumulation
MDILKELEKMPLEMKTEIILRAFAEQVKANALILSRISEVLDRLEEREAELAELIKHLKTHEWGNVLREEMERRRRTRKCINLAKKKRINISG